MSESGIDKSLNERWRDLGIYYDFDERVSVNQWRFYGSKDGITSFADHILSYAENLGNDRLGEHDHFGPYMYLTLATSDKPVIEREKFAGTLNDLKELAQLILMKVSNSKPGQTFNIDKDYGTENTVTAKFFVMDESFDPALMDELIVSKRQAVVNQE